MLPFYKIRTHRVSPVHGAPLRLIGKILIEQMICPVIPDKAIGIIDPVFGRPLMNSVPVHDSFLLFCFVCSFILSLWGIARPVFRPCRQGKPFNNFGLRRCVRIPITLKMCFERLLQGRVRLRCFRMLHMIIPELQFISVARGADVQMVYPRREPVLGISLVIGLPSQRPDRDTQKRPS